MPRLDLAPFVRDRDAQTVVLFYDMWVTGGKFVYNRMRRSKVLS